MAQDKPKDYARSEALQCRWGAWSVIDYGELRLDLHPMDCCDMNGAVKVATTLMPEVKRIVTFKGSNRDAEYRMTRTGWQAYLPPQPGLSLYDVARTPQPPL